MNQGSRAVRVAAVVPLTLAALSLLVAGCSNRNAPQTDTPRTGNVTVTPGPGGVQAITIHGDDDLRFHPSTFHVRPGTVKITLHDSGATPHELAFTGKLRNQISITMQGQSNSMEFTVRVPGRYPFICGLHERENMTGTMIVDPAR